MIFRIHANSQCTSIQPVRKDGEPFARLPPASSDYWKMLKEWEKSIEVEEQ